MACGGRTIIRIAATRVLTFIIPLPLMLFNTCRVPSPPFIPIECVRLSVSLGRFALALALTCVYARRVIRRERSERARVRMETGDDAAAAADSVEQAVKAERRAIAKQTMTISGVAGAGIGSLYGIARGRTGLLAIAVKSGFGGAASALLYYGFVLNAR